MTGIDDAPSIRNPLSAAPLRPRVIAAAARRRMPWKNGGGETFEVAVHPTDAGAAFGWRISMATVASDGPFSDFPGIDRTLCLLTGVGMELDVEGRPTERLQPSSPPFSFPGDAPTRARLLGGPVTDLNVMTRRGHYHHTVERFDITAPIRRPAQAGWSFVVCGHGRFQVDDADLCLDGNDTLACDDSSDLRVRPASGAATAFLIRITAVA